MLRGRMSCSECEERLCTVCTVECTHTQHPGQSSNSDNLAFPVHQTKRTEKWHAEFLSYKYTHIHIIIIQDYFSIFLLKDTSVREHSVEWRGATAVISGWGNMDLKTSKRSLLSLWVKFLHTNIGR